jgi:hypothetical protein
MSRASVALCSEDQAAPRKHSEHGRVLRQDVRYEFLNSGTACDPSEMTQQDLANASALMLIHNGEGHLGPLGFGHDITRPPDKFRLAVLPKHGNQCHVRNEINIQEE